VPVSDQASPGHDLESPSTIEPVIRCFATDSVDKFQRLGSRFLERPVGEVELVDLGG
jgi:glutamate racemase